MSTHSETLELEASDGAHLSAFHVTPSGTVRGRVVVLQEIFGVNDHIRRVTESFAAHGYEALAPALFDRIQRDVALDYDATGVKDGRALAIQLGLDKPLLDVAAAVQRLAPNGERVGVVGYCWGGSLAYLSAARVAGLSAAVGYYGSLIAKFAAEPPRVPTLLHFGELDKGIPLQDVEQIRAQRPEVELYVYPADHGFNCDARASYARESAEQALRRTLAFFERQIG